jgi:uncharacterized protein (DUF302 family)
MMRMVAKAMAILATIALFGHAAAADDMRTYAKQGMAYDDVRMDLETAIEGKGLRIGAVGDLGDMLDRTRADLNAGAAVYKSAHYMQFCSAVYAHKLAAADPTNLGHCPFLMFIYETVAKPGEVVIGYRPFARTGSAATQAVLAEVDALFDDIAREALK